MRYEAFANPRIFCENPEAKREVAVFSDLDFETCDGLASGVYVEIFAWWGKYLVDGYCQRSTMGRNYFNETFQAASYKEAVLWALEYIEQSNKFLNVSVLGNTTSDKARLLGEIRRQKMPKDVGLRKGA